MGLAEDLGDEDRDEDVEEVELGPVVDSLVLFLAFLVASEDVEQDDEVEDGALGSSSWPLELVLLDLFIFILRLGEAGAIESEAVAAAALAASF